LTAHVRGPAAGGVVNDEEARKMLTGLPPQLMR
jgi:hypothetical protein